jgi:hypothetical protein
MQIRSRRLPIMINNNLSKIIKNSLLFSVGYFLNSTVKMNVNPEKYNK